MMFLLMPKAIQSPLSAVPWKAEKHDVCEFKYVAKRVAVNCNMWLVTQKAIRTLVFMS